VQGWKRLRRPATTLPAQGQTGAVLRLALHEVIKGHSVLPYSSRGCVRASSQAHPARKFELPGDEVIIHKDGHAVKEIRPSILVIGVEPEGSPTMFE